MTFTIEVGWWIIPALITLLALIWLRAQDDGGDLVGPLVTVPLAGFVSALAWAIYGLLT